MHIETILRILMSVVPFNPNQNASENRIVPFSGRPSDAVEEVMGKIVSEGAQKRYNSENITLMMWLFDQDPDEFLHDSIVIDALQAHEWDQAEKTKRRKYLRGICKNSMMSYFRTQLDKHGVDVRLETPVSFDDMEQMDNDKWIVATGVHPQKNMFVMSVAVVTFPSLCPI